MYKKTVFSVIPVGILVLSLAFTGCFMDVDDHVIDPELHGTWVTADKTSTVTFTDTDITWSGPVAVLFPSDTVNIQAWDAKDGNITYIYIHGDHTHDEFLCRYSLSDGTLTLTDGSRTYSLVKGTGGPGLPFVEPSGSWNYTEGDLTVTFGGNNSITFTADLLMFNPESYPEDKKPNANTWEAKNGIISYEYQHEDHTHRANACTYALSSDGDRLVLKWNNNDYVFEKS